MNITKLAFALIVTGIVSPAFADSGSTSESGEKLPVERYTSSTHLDVKRVIASTDVSDKCGPVPVQITYEDSMGKRHIAEYLTMGINCTN
ncbi:DUF2790 domain-containing protein [Pseudomonas sp. NPDC090202]|uniref:DUF2790 domain-containing protein n=1 Tax=Pseudomonas sp. NPDC090202 TaxID=3364476 RepID=UPI003809C692